MKLHEQLERHAYADVPIAVTPAEASAAYEAFWGLLNLPLEYRQAGDYAISGASNGVFGYKRRVRGSDNDGRHVSRDTKHAYHYGSHTQQAFEASNFARLPSEVREFCEKIDPIYWMTVACLRNTLERLHDELPGSNHRRAPNLRPEFLDPTRLLNIHLRLVGYELPSPDTENVAEPHFDRSVFTLAVDETDKGLEIGFADDGSDLKPVDHSPGIAKFFAGGGWEMMPTDFTQTYDFIQPAYHRARNIGEYSRQYGSIVRGAIIGFANPLNYATDVAPEQSRPQRLMAAAAA